MRSPLWTYCSIISAMRSHAVQRCHSVFSCCWPLRSVNDRLVATENLATRLPPPVVRISGSFPTLPMSITLFNERAMIPLQTIRDREQDRDRPTAEKWAFLSDSAMAKRDRYSERQRLNASCSLRVTGPGLPLPIILLSTLEIG